MTRLFPLLRLVSLSFALAITAMAAERTGTALNRNPKASALQERVIYEEEPVYPVSARYARHEGSGTFWIHIDPSGRVDAVKIVESTRYKDLDNAAVYALYRWRFKPGKTAQALVPITFSLTTHSIGVHRY